MPELAEICCLRAIKGNRMWCNCDCLWSLIGIPHIYAEFSRWQFVDFIKFPAEIVAVGKSAFVGNFSNAFVGIKQLLCGTGNAQSDQILHRRESGYLFENKEKVPSGHPYFFCQCIYFYLFGVMLFYIIQNFADLRVYFIGFFCIFMETAQRYNQLTLNVGFVKIL